MNRKQLYFGLSGVLQDRIDLAQRMGAGDEVMRLLSLKDFLARELIANGEQGSPSAPDGSMTTGEYRCQFRKR